MKRLAVAALVVGFTMSATSGYAQDVADRVDETEVSAPVSVTPFLSMGSSTSSRIGATVVFRVASALSVEAEMGYRRSEVDALSLNVGLLCDLPRVGRVTPYLAAGVGIEEYGTARADPGVGLTTTRRIGLAVNAGGGIRVPMNKDWGLRTDARWFNGTARDAPEHWRIYHGLTFAAGRK